jgi:hypothetical protein
MNFGHTELRGLSKSPCQTVAEMSDLEIEARLKRTRGIEE